MAIEFNCPHCQLLYRLKDEFAGKRATCKNPDCRQVIVIPKPVTVPQDQPMPSAAELEAAALSALSDDHPTEKAPTEQVIPMTCSFCDRKWTEPITKAGKNILCPNPECRQRLKVPEPKTDQPIDWRQTRTRLPTLAKQNFEKLENVEDAAEAKYVSGVSLREAGATGIEIEPRTLREKMVIGLTIGGVLVGLCLGVAYLMRSGKIVAEDHLLVDARKQFTEASAELGSPEADLCGTLLVTIEAEYALRKNTPSKFTEAHKNFSAARDVLQKLPSDAERNALAAELILAITDEGGTSEQAKEQIRYRWQPEMAAGNLKVNDRPHSVHEELRLWLSLLSQADYDFRVGAARKLTRELFRKGQPGIAADVIPLELFRDESDKGRAVVALELYRLDANSDLARRIAGDLKTHYASTKGPLPPAQVQTLLAALMHEKLNPASADPNRVNLGVKLLEGDSDGALKLTQVKATPEKRLEALLQCSDWMSAPATALEDALVLIENQKGKKEVRLSQSQLLRLCENAAATGSLDLAKKLASYLTDEGLRAWAIGNAIRIKLAANPKEQVEVSMLELPEDTRKLKVGHAWGVYWIARRNAALTGDSAAQKKVISGWAAPLRPFGLTGLALGLQDR